MLACRVAGGHGGGRQWAGGTHNCRQSLDGGIHYVRSPRHLAEVEHYSYQRELQRRIKQLRRA